MYWVIKSAHLRAAVLALIQHGPKDSRLSLQEVTVDFEERIVHLRRVKLAPKLRLE
jgi:hypothetical protein